MNVLYFVLNFPKLSESFILNEIYELKQRGHEVAVFALGRPDEGIEHEEYADLDVPVHYAGTLPISGFDSFLPRVLNERVLRQCAHRSYPWTHLRYLRLADECIRYVDTLGFSIDHVHSHFAVSDMIAATYVASYYRVPFTVTAHAYEIYKSPNVRQLKTLFERTNRVLVPSEYNESYLRRLTGFSGPVDVVPATTRVSKFDPSTGDVPVRLLTIARLVEKKGVIYAIEAVAQLRDEFPEIEYHIIGTGSREQAIRQRAAELNVEEYVTFLGNVSDERLMTELDEAAVFVLPCVIAADGDRDGSPVALKEAMTMETPCVSTTMTGIPEMIDDGVNGSLVEPRNVNALTEAIAEMLSSDERRAEFGRRARERIESEFSLDVAIDRLVASFERAKSEHQRVSTPRAGPERSRSEQ